MIVSWTSVAEAELDEVWTYIAADNLDAADRTAERIRNSANMLADYPSLGHRGRLSGTRELIVPNLPYILIYRRLKQSVEILRVHHTSRDWPPKPRRSS